jgi:hypothetical protein
MPTKAFVQEQSGSVRDFARLHPYKKINECSLYGQLHTKTLVMRDKKTWNNPLLRYTNLFELSGTTALVDDNS